MTNLAAAVELKACPFCGATELERNDSVFWTGMKNEVTRYRIQHHCKDAQGRVYRRIEVGGTAYVEMVEAWNTRPPALGELSDAQLVALYSELRHTSKEFCGLPHPMENWAEAHDAAIAKAAREFLGKVDG